MKDIQDESIEQPSAVPQDSRVPAYSQRRVVFIGLAILTTILFVGAVTWRVVRDDDVVEPTEDQPVVRGELADIIVHFSVDPLAADMLRLIGDVTEVPGVAAAEFSPASVITGVAPGAETIEIGEAVIGVRIDDAANIGAVIDSIELVEGVRQAEARPS